VRPGTRTRLWLDVRKLHLFDPSDGSSMTRPKDATPAAGVAG
jgi:hypothetical protein